MKHTNSIIPGFSVASFDENNSLINSSFVSVKFQQPSLGQYWLDSSEAINAQLPSSSGIQGQAILASLVNQVDELQTNQLMFQQELNSLRVQYSVLQKQLFTHKQELNINKLKTFADLQSNWDGAGAVQFSDLLIQRVSSFIMDKRLKVQPSIFPTLRNSIQFEFRFKHIFIEVEIFETSIEYIINDDSTSKSNTFSNLTWDNIVARISSFASTFSNR